MSTFTNTEYNPYFENYPYELSDFQKHAIKAIVDGNHTLVTAHTGSGKTLPAEFAIKHFVGKGKKVIYTSPIKALSNQKYYEFSRKFPDITFGLLTGDIKTNPDADVLIMTTEILMNKLFRMHDETPMNARLTFNMNIEQDLAAVVFDECHYINDAHRGHVWEQCILMLPTQVQMVLLSATIDNPAKFAQWIMDSKGSKTSSNNVYSKTLSEEYKHVIICSTNHRVVPLTHYMFVTTNEGLHKKINDKSVSTSLRKTLNTCLTIQDSGGAFNSKNYGEVSNILSLMEKHGIGTTRKQVLNTLVEHMNSSTGGSSGGSSMLPAIVFVFSRKLVEQCAEEVTVPLFAENNPDTVDIPYHKIRHECFTIIRRLPNWQEYADLPEFVRLVNLLEKGIGIHHSGMLPVLREIVELMISKKYIRVLFATESFAIGLDCPIKSAVFISLKKFDGSSGGSGGSGGTNAGRYLFSHEYTQMAGRAGRRGIDTIGNVIHCANLFENATLPSQRTYSEILGGQPQRLVSKFKIDYKVVMNLLAVESSCKDLNTDLTQTICDFIDKSMMSSDMGSLGRGLKQGIEELKMKISEMEQQVLSTPIEILKEYCKMEDIRSMASNKKLKEIDGRTAEMRGSNPNMVKDLEIYKKIKLLQAEHAVKESEMVAVANYAQGKVENVLSVLAERGISACANGIGIDNQKMLICSSIAEVNPVLMTALFEEYNDFADFTPELIASLLTLFADVRIRVDDEFYVENPFLDYAFVQFKHVCDELGECERAHGLEDPVDSEEFLYSALIADDVLEWCRSDTETACKQVLYDLMSYKGIGVGDFTKALLKISTVVRELISVCEKTFKIELRSRLSQIDRLLLKHVTTNQSLYL
jgi:superfamily II RNA helicase